MRRREPHPVECHQQIAGGGRQSARNRHRTKQIAIVRIARQISADAGPQVVQPATPPVARLDKAAPQLNAVLQDIVHPPVVMEQTVTVDPLQAALCQLDGRRHKAVSADDLEVFFIPQDQMQIVVVIPVDIPPFAAAFPDRAEGDFPQASQLAQQRRVLLAVALPEVNHFAIGGAAQAFGLVQFAFEQRPVFRTGDGAFGFKPPRQPFAQLFKVLIAAAGKLASAGLGIEPARPGDLLADTHRQAAVAPAKHLLHQQEQRQVVGDQRTGVKQGAVAGVNPRRQQRGAIFCRQLNKAGVPFFIADAATGEAGDFPRREEDQHPAGLQLLVHLLQRRFSGAAMNIIYRDKQRTQGLKVGEHAVGDHFDIAAHAGYRIQERQAVEGAGGVVGDNDQRAIFGDLFEIVRRDGAADIEVFQHLFDRIKPLQVAVTVGKLLKLFLIK